jgi:hypothetical protein
VPSLLLLSSLSSPQAATTNMNARNRPSQRAPRRCLIIDISPYATYRTTIAGDETRTLANRQHGVGAKA